MVDVAKYLTEHNIKPSMQRMAIMQYLLDNATHPTVDVIYKALLPKMPTLSRTTVYNTLSVLNDNGALQSITIDDKTVHYDGNIMPHGHFLCNKCGKIFDFDLPNDILIKIENLNGFNITEAQLYYKGECNDCKNDKTN